MRDNWNMFNCLRISCSCNEFTISSWLRLLVSLQSRFGQAFAKKADSWWRPTRLQGCPMRTNTNQRRQPVSVSIHPSDYDRGHHPAGCLSYVYARCKNSNCRAIVPTDKLSPVEYCVRVVERRIGGNPCQIILSGFFVNNITGERQETLGVRLIRDIGWCNVVNRRPSSWGDILPVLCYSRPFPDHTHTVASMHTPPSCFFFSSSWPLLCRVAFYHSSVLGTSGGRGSRRRRGC